MARQGWKVVLTGLLLLSAIVLLAATCYLGLQAGRVWENNRRFGFAARHVTPEGSKTHLMSSPAKLLWAFREALGLNRFYSDYGQDKWVSEFVFPNVKDGYFADVGSGDGVVSSNTKSLEALGWKGICVDPFPTNTENRDCVLFREVVYSVPGNKVRFRDSGQTGAIRGVGGEGGATHEGEHRIVELTTTTLDDILARAGAPSFIHYMSIDIEGAELEALKGLSFEKYTIGALTIEHNYEEPRRSQVAELLRANGYRFVQSLYRDDCFVFEDWRAFEGQAAVR